MTELSLLPLFLVGLLGGTHCAGMCGGIVTALSFNRRGSWARPLAYNAGRISSYVLAGGLVGALGQGGLLMGRFLPVQQSLYLAANLMLLALGLYLAGVSGVVTRFERAGTVVWRRLQPLSQGLLPADTLPKTFLLGALWGWIPCGLVYTALLTALASGSAATGALLMLAFGLGTLPNLLALSFFLDRLKPFFQGRPVRFAAGLLVLGFGVVGLLRLSQLDYARYYGIVCHALAGS